MFFKRIELNGFKSFADSVIIEFTKGMTCIVGPNGSGKSNISDAIRWVLGEQSPKMLRGGRMEEIIFSGTQTRRPKGMAEVTLVIDNSDKTLPSEYAEIAVSRRMYRSGESEYMINRSPCRLRDIRELIMDTGLGVEGYSIIGQGRIADIVDNRLDSRREIFEEAAGVSRYRSKKEDAERKLQSASENLSRVNDIVREIESRIDGLEKDSEKAAEYLKLREKYNHAQINIILKNIEQSEGRSEAVRTELSELSSLVLEAEERKGEAEELLREAREKNSSLGEKLNRVKDEILKKSGEIFEISGKEKLSGERLSSLERERERLERELSSAAEKLRREGESANAAKDAKEALDAECVKLKEDLNLKSSACSVLSEKLKDIESKLADAREAIFSAAGKQNSAAAEISGMENLKNILSAREKELREASGDGGSSAEARISELKKERETLLAEAEKLAEASALGIKCSAALALKAEELSEKLGKLRVAGGQYAERLRLLDELERSREGYGSGVKFILKQNIKGIIGTLGELLEVPKGLETAVESVLGAKLQDIVCKDEETAKEAIRLLKESKAGRLTFLPVDVLRFDKKQVSPALKKSPGFLGLASEMVSCRGGHRCVIEYMLGRVIFVDNLNNAVLLSKKNDGGWRFATAEGEVINAAGAITGGSSKNRTSNILSRKAAKSELSEKLKENLKEVKALEEEAAKNKKEIAENKASEKVLASEKQKNETSLAVISGELDSLEKTKQDLKAAEERKIHELSDLKKEIGRAEEKLAGFRTEAERAAEKKAEAERNAGLYLKEAEAARAEAAKAAEAESEAKLALGAAGVKLKAAGDLEGRILLGIEEIEREQGSRKREIEKIEIGRREAEAFLESAGGVLRGKEEEKEALEAEAGSLSSAAKDLSAELERLESERSEADKKLSDGRIKKHDAELRSARFEAQTESFKEKLWDEFEISYAEALEHEEEGFVFSRGAKEARECRERIRELGDVNVGAIEEYKSTRSRLDFLAAQRDDILRAMKELRTVIEDTDNTIKKRFRENFDAVAANFETSFGELFKGGFARLTLEDPDDPLTSSIEIEAQPPGKKLQNMNLLSGGEKTMTAIALMFAVLKAKPAPFVILDEVEAALDETNIDCFARYLRDFGATQFALITHQKATMEYADSLYGVTMPEHGISKVLSIRLDSSES